MDRLPAQVVLEDRHYLGRSYRAVYTYHDEFGVMVFAAPTARALPADWLELVRWCLDADVPNAGSRQWKRAIDVIRVNVRTNRGDGQVSTVVSYSDPSVGHTGALYRACNWLWAPTWHRIKPPPSGNGRWTVNTSQSVKDRWVAILGPDVRREAILSIKDAKVMREVPWVQYREPKWKRGIPILATGGGDYKRFMKLRTKELLG